MGECHVHKGIRAETLNAARERDPVAAEPFIGRDVRLGRLAHVDVVLADEPADRRLRGPAASARRDATGATLMIITHDAALAQRCDRIVEMVDGRIAA